MKKIYALVFSLLILFVAQAQTVIDINSVNSAFTKTVDGELVIDVATTASKIAAPLLSYENPFKGKTLTEAEISFDVFTYHPDSTKVLGALFSFFDPAIPGRMYFSNGSYLGFNVTGTGWFDANMKSYGLDKNFIGHSAWVNIKLQFTATGFTMLANNELAFNQSSTDVTIASGDNFNGNYQAVLNFLGNAPTFAIGVGSWWSDNQRGDGSFWDNQFSYMKNIKFSTKISNPNQTSIDINAIDAAYKKTIDGAEVIDVATTASKVTAPLLSFENPFLGKTLTEVEIAFDVMTYFPDSTKVLGALFSFFNAAIPGRMYFSNGSYLGFNVTGTGWMDANMKSYGIDKNFIGTSLWKNIKLQFTATGFAMYVDNTLAFNQSSTDVTIASGDNFNGNYQAILTFLQEAPSFIIGTGSWWSDNQRGDGSYWDNQFSYLKNITLSTTLSPITAKTKIATAPNGRVIREEFFNLNGVKTTIDFSQLERGIYIKRSVYSNGAITSTKILKSK